MYESWIPRNHNEDFIIGKFLAMFSSRPTQPNYNNFFCVLFSGGYAHKEVGREGIGGIRFVEGAASLPPLPLFCIENISDPMSDRTCISYRLNAEGIEGGQWLGQPNFKGAVALLVPLRAASGSVFYRAVECGSISTSLICFGTCAICPMILEVYRVGDIFSSQTLFSDLAY